VTLFGNLFGPSREERLARYKKIASRGYHDGDVFQCGEIQRRREAMQGGRPYTPTTTADRNARAVEDDYLCGRCSWDDFMAYHYGRDMGERDATLTYVMRCNDVNSRRLAELTSIKLPPPPSVDRDRDVG
jgi:hypothetical protein